MRNQPSICNFRTELINSLEGASVREITSIALLKKLIVYR